MNDFILSIDQSTTSSKVYLIDRKGHIVDRISRPHQKYFPEEGWSEHDPEEILENVKYCLKQLVKRNEPYKDAIRAISITNQRESVLIWDKTTGKPIYPAIVWQCTRTYDACQKLRDAGHEEMVLEKTGLKIDPYFSATKLKWILDHVQPESTGSLAAGTIDSWLVWNLDEHHNHFTDHTNASRTLLYNLHEKNWDPSLCTLFGIDPGMLPTIQVSDALFGSSDLDGLLSRPIPITGIIGDSQAAFYAQCCFSPGETKMTLGTGSSLMMNSKKAASQGLVKVLGYQLKDMSCYGLEAIVSCNGECINWARDELKLFSDYAELNESLFEKEQNVVFVPALTGLGIPEWNGKARGIFAGMDRSCTRKDLLAAILDGILCQLCDAMVCLGEEMQGPIRVDGGISQNEVLMQRLADLSGQEIQVSVHEDLSAMGSWMAAAHALDWELEWFERPILHYQPKMREEKRRAILDRYHTAIECSVRMAQI